MVKKKKKKKGLAMMFRGRGFGSVCTSPGKNVGEKESLVLSHTTLGSSQCQGTDILSHLSAFKPSVSLYCSHLGKALVRSGHSA